MSFGFQVKDSEDCPGTTGLLVDNTPRLTSAHVRPFVWAIILYRGAVHSWEVVNALSAICSTADMKISDDDDDDRTTAEICVDTVLAEMIIEGLLRYNEKKDVWVLVYSPNNVSTVIKAVAGVNGTMPQHFLLDMAQETAK
tara:strand:- start:3302 stop:3724 length:423 start_codon:yes stop_codon:yes gene_type:complete